jgi:hypothetical protein
MPPAERVSSRNQMDYETPREGTTLGSYVARRLHKTKLLASVPDLRASDSARALAQIAIYAAAASTSFGTALYQPDGDPIGKVIETVDPETQARVIVTCEGNLRFSYHVEMDGVGVLSGSEIIQSTTIGLRGLGMPAPTTFTFTSAPGDYAAEIVGIITSELAPGIGRWKIRGFGSLDLSDNQGNRGRLSLDRTGLVFVSITARGGRTIVLKERLG